MSANISIIRRERFRKVASKRVQKVLDGLDNLSKCSNKRNYDYDDEEVAKMIKAIKEQTRLLEIAFLNQKSTKNTFKF